MWMEREENIAFLVQVGSINIRERWRAIKNEQSKDAEERPKKNKIKYKQNKTNKEHTIQEIQKMNNMDHAIKQEVKPDAPKV